MRKVSKRTKDEDDFVAEKDTGKSERAKDRNCSKAKKGRSCIAKSTLKSQLANFKHIVRYIA